MTNKKKVLELSKNEIGSLAKFKTFNRFYPSVCTVCGHKKSFKRRMFEVEGDCDIGQDDSQNLLRHYIKEQHDLDCVHFRGVNNRNYIDMASCPKCGSNAVAFDIKMDEEMFDEISKRFNVSKDKFKKEVKIIHDRLTQK